MLVKYKKDVDENKRTRFKTSSSELKTNDAEVAMVYLRTYHSYFDKLVYYLYNKKL